MNSPVVCIFWTQAQHYWHFIPFLFPISKQKQCIITHRRCKMQDFRGGRRSNAGRNWKWPTRWHWRCCCFHTWWLFSAVNTLRLLVLYWVCVWELHVGDKYKRKMLGKGVLTTLTPFHPFHTIMVLLLPPRAFCSSLVRTESLYGTRRFFPIDWSARALYINKLHYYNK